MEQEKNLTETTSSLERIQEYDVGKFDRAAELGTSLNLDAAMQPARRVIEIFRRIPLDTLKEFPSLQLEQIRSEADQVYNIFTELAEYDTSVDNPSAKKDALIRKVEALYDSVFSNIFQFISFSAARSADFPRLEREGRSAVQGIEDRTAELTEALKAAQTEAQEIIEDVRKVAAEQGVSQMAIYFKEESDYHTAQANEWKTFLYRWTGGLLAYGLVSLHLHLVPWLQPSNSFEFYQLAIGKVLIFAILGFILFLASRNFLSHKHNAITNKHRQNALVTFKALVDAGGTMESRDTVLRYAAASIFSPQDTGMVRQTAGTGGSANTLIELGSQHLSD